jgi:hypothetical protein
MNDRIHFLPPSSAAKLRQKIWSLLQKRSSDAILLKELAELVESEYRDTYAAAKVLVRKGLAERVNIPTPAPSKKNPGRTKSVIALKGIPAWGKSAKGSWK